MKTLRLVVPVAALAVTTLSACCNSAEKDDVKSEFTLEAPSHNLFGDEKITIRFGCQKQKDETALANERMSARWNRNLYLMDSYASLDDYAEEAEPEP